MKSKPTNTTIGLYDFPWLYLLVQVSKSVYPPPTHYQSECEDTPNDFPKDFSSLQLQDVNFSLLKQCFNRDDRVSYIILIMYGIVYSNYQSKLFLAS